MSVCAAKGSRGRPQTFVRFHAPVASRRSETPAQHKNLTMQKAKLRNQTIIRERKMTIYICGDSTAATYPPENAPITGWGQLLGDYLPNVNVVNKAVGSRSTKSFLAEGRLTDIERTIQPGDLLLIQFTHNDTSDLVWRHTDPNTSFSANLEIYVDTARLHGAIPVLVTPIPRRYWRDGELVDAHGAYPDAIRRLAKKRNIHLLDVTGESMAKFRQMGEEATYPLYTNVEPGLYPPIPTGRRTTRIPSAPGGVFREK